MKIKLIDFGLKEKHYPFRPHENDAGADVFMPYDCTLQPGEIARIPLGFGLIIPDGFLYASIAKFNKSLRFFIKFVPVKYEIPLSKCSLKYLAKFSSVVSIPLSMHHSFINASYISLYSPAKVYQDISTLLSELIGTSVGTVFSCKEKQKAHLHKIFQFLIPVFPFNLESLSLA